MRFFHVSDLHGKPERYSLLFDEVEKSAPEAVLLGGDLLPGGYGRDSGNPAFWEMFRSGLERCAGLPNPVRILAILGNDDPAVNERAMRALESDGLLEYVHGRAVGLGPLHVAGYSFVPPSPFMLKDWERYDVSRFTGVGCVSPEDGMRSVNIEPEEARYYTIERDLELLAHASDPGRTIYMFHSPPHETCLDRVANDGKMIDHAPADLHVGSIAIRRFIERRQPFLTLHGHIHESVRLTGCWRERIGRTHAFGAAHDGDGLALVRFNTSDLESATREVLTR